MLRLLLLISCCSFQSLLFSQNKYKIIIEKNDGTEIPVNLEDISRIYFRNDDYIDTQYSSCPNNSHPHMIDLGLPSGTKWSCCNIGANTPQGRGDFYAWAETKTRTLYNNDNYEYFNNGKYDDLTDICASSYDVAFLTERGYMPSLSQMRELKYNCIAMDVSIGNQRGKCFKGPNGNCIFLPYNGSSWNGKNENASTGEYWSGTRDPKQKWNAYYVQVGLGFVDIISWMRAVGRVIRPVSKVDDF